MSNTEICRIGDIQDNDAKGMVAVVDGKQRNIFVARKGKEVFAYLNWCPHNQVLIDQIPNKFFNADKSYIQCSKHGALFQVDNGMCIEGPCEGESLKLLTTTVEDGVVSLVE
jgi:nitrite reductase/ring-hydroxylating ferredoxin subunit